MTSEIATLSEQFASFNAGNSDVVSTIVGDDFNDKMRLVSALENSKPIRDHLGTTITLADVVVERAQYTDEKTGEVQIGPRVTLVDASGESYVASSEGVYNSVRRLLNIAGTPDRWQDNNPMFKVVEAPGKLGRYMTFEYVTGPVAAKK